MNFISYVDIRLGGGVAENQNPVHLHL